MSTLATSPAAVTCPPPLTLSNGRFAYACADQGLLRGGYLTPQDVRNFALPSRTTKDITDSILWFHCAAVSSEFRGYARKRYRLPLLSWGAGVVQKLAFRAAGSALRQRGFAEDGNEHIMKAYEESGQWMVDVRDYKIDVDVLESQPIVGTPRASSLPLRGW